MDFRGFSGQIASGRIVPGDEIRIVPSGKNTHIKSIVTMAADGSIAMLDEARAGQSVTVTLTDEVIARAAT